MALTADQRRALNLLATAGPSGRTEGIMAAHFDVELLAGLVRTGLVQVEVADVRAGGRAIEVVRMRITDAGRRALAT
jgi:hypothetical protein